MSIGAASCGEMAIAAQAAAKASRPTTAERTITPMADSIEQPQRR